MKLHTHLSAAEVGQVLTDVKARGLIAPDIDFAVFTPGASQSRERGYEIQLGTNYNDTLPDGYTDQNGTRMRTRRTRNGTGRDDSARFAATWHEWGWLIAYMFEADPESRWDYYASAADFNRKTRNQFLPRRAEMPRGHGQIPPYGRHFERKSLPWTGEDLASRAYFLKSDPRWYIRSDKTSEVWQVFYIDPELSVAIAMGKACPTLGIAMNRLLDGIDRGFYQAVMPQGGTP